VPRCSPQPYPSLLGQRAFASAKKYSVAANAAAVAALANASAISVGRLRWYSDVFLKSQTCTLAAPTRVDELSAPALWHNNRREDAAPNTVPVHVLAVHVRARLHECHRRLRVAVL
jgi:hypothetical protein